MKILVMSLLRLGDILLATSVLGSLKRANPEAEIHILINGQFKSVASLIPYADRVFTFDRDGIQKIIGHRDRSLLEAYFRVEDLVESLQHEKYDKVINLTHNRLSGWLAALVGSPQTQGVVFSHTGRFSLGSQWFEYLNDNAEASPQNVFHFVDVFHYGAGLNQATRRIELVETAYGKSFAEAQLQNLHGRHRILVQACSAEPKKTLDVTRWRAVLQLLGQAEPQADIVVLGAPDEASLIEQICQGSRALPLVCSLEEAFSVVNRSQLLITVDTSVKHLAAATKIKILEISLGSSEYRKTGAYTQGAVIIQGRAPCAPCPHRSPCSQPTHACADRISPELIALSASAILRQDEGALRVLAHEFCEEAQMMRTTINASGDWSAYPMSRKFSISEISSWIDRISHKLYLQRAHEKQVGEFGTEGLQLKQLLESIFPDHPGREWVSELKSLESNISWFESQLARYLGGLRDVLSEMDEPKNLEVYLGELNEFVNEVVGSPILNSYARPLLLALRDARANGLPFQIIKVLREKLSMAHQRTKIEIKLIRGLANGFMEIV